VSTRKVDDPVKALGAKPKPRTDTIDRRSAGRPGRSGMIDDHPPVQARSLIGCERGVRANEVGTGTRRVTDQR
jgi:hypothetical protein